MASSLLTSISTFLIKYNISPFQFHPTPSLLLEIFQCLAKNHTIILCNAFLSNMISDLIEVKKDFIQVKIEDIHLFDLTWHDKIENSFARGKHKHKPNQKEDN
jgi:hypothetical protein